MSSMTRRISISNLPQRARLQFLLCLLVLFACSGCATPLLPRKQDAFFRQTAQNKKVLILPFEVSGYTIFSKANNRERLKKVEEAANEYFIAALQDSLRDRGFQVLGHIPLKTFKDGTLDDYAQDVFDDLFEEYSYARYGIAKNLNDEKNKPFDYSIGMRAKELNDILGKNADAFVIIAPYGFIQMLDRFDTATNITMAVISIGMSLIAETPDDIIGIQLAITNARDGSIVWFDEMTFPSRSLLLEKHIRQTVEKMVEKIPQ